MIFHYRFPPPLNTFNAPRPNHQLTPQLGTSDKDFTGRERQGKGAYADTDGKFELNKTGPAGNTALTGREGNLDNNPVREAGAHNAHATDSSSHSHTTGSNATAHDAAVAGEHTGEKKGFLAKVSICCQICLIWVRADVIRSRMRFCKRRLGDWWSEEK